MSLEKPPELFVPPSYHPSVKVAATFVPMDDTLVYGTQTPRISDIIDRLSEQQNDFDCDLVSRAYVFAATAHQGMTRRSGEPYLNHPLAVADILADMRLDAYSIAAGLLHDTVEDTPVTVDDLRRNFGPEVANIVDGVTKIGQINFNSVTERKASNMRKMIMAMLTDLRVILVKLADRLNNMRTLGFMPPEKQQLISQETLEIFTPLASRLGIHKIQSEMEDLCLFYLEPQVYERLRSVLVEGRNDRQDYVREVKEYLSTRTAEFGIKAEIEGRPKHIYSIWRKMCQQNLPFEQIFDLVAFRIIVDQVQECYSALGVIHSLFKPIPGRFKDYISLPKTNGYRSLHTAVVGLRNMRMEVQIRTREMHNYAENGIAAHWRYKDGSQVSNEESMRINNLRSILSWQNNLDDPGAFLNSLKESLAENDSIYIFTPAGEVKELPVGATPLDFAYSIHSDVGHHCGGARINGLMAPIRQTLQSGDTVEILTSRATSPSRDWLRHVVSPKAKAKLRQWFAAEEKKQAVDFGRELLIREMKKYNLPKNRLTTELLRELGFNDLDELNAAVAFGRISLKKILEKISPELLPPPEPQAIVPEVKVTRPEPRENIKGILVQGQKDIFTRFAQCCSPLPGEPIVGYISQGHGITIHIAQCQSLVGLDADRLIPVTWDSEPVAEITYEVYIKIQARHTQGGISHIITAISDRVTDILEAHTNDAREGKLWFKLAVRDFNQYTALLRDLKNMSSLIERVDRFYPSSEGLNDDEGGIDRN